MTYNTQKLQAIYDKIHIDRGKLQCHGRPVFFGLNYTIPDEAAEYAIAQYKATAEAFTAAAGKILDADGYLEWLAFTENKLPVLTYIPVLAASSKKVVGKAEECILAAPASERAAIIEAVSVALPKLKKNGEAAAERILVLLKSTTSTKGLNLASNLL